MRRRTTWKWAAGALTLSAILLVAWFSHGSPTDALPVKPQPPAAIPEGRADPLAAPPPAAQTPTQDQPIGQSADICGFGKVSLDPDDPAAAKKFVADHVRVKVTQWMRSLRNSDDVHSRATGLYMEGAGDDSAAQQLSTQEARDELVQLALGARDPAVYALALSKCQSDGGGGDGACAQISYAAWARLDPDNAVPWLAVADRARDRGDVAAAADAMNHAAAAHRESSYIYSLETFAANEAPSDVSALERAYVSAEITTAEAGHRFYSMAQLDNYCSGEGVRIDDTRRQCSALAERWVDQGDVINLVVGTGIGVRLGWPKERTQTLRRQIRSAVETLQQMTPQDRRAQWSCANLDIVNAYAADKAHIGELAALRKVAQRANPEGSDTAH